MRVRAQLTLGEVLVGEVRILARGDLNCSAALALATGCCV
jgi:hypothetical protein